MDNQRPLILFTNDDGVRSPGLLAAATAFADIAELLVVAPEEQQSGMGRSLPLSSSGAIHEHFVEINGQPHTFYGVGGTPAQAVQSALFEVALKRRPKLIISGINYGENTGNGVTISGTVGAALEGAALGIPSIAISQRTPKNLHLTYSPKVDFTAGAHYARVFGKWMLGVSDLAGQDIDLLKIDLPLDATPQTPWRMTRLSRSRVYWPARDNNGSHNGAAAAAGPLGYYQGDTSRSEPDSDVYAIFEDGVVSVTPMSLDMTSRLDLDTLRQSIEANHKLTF